MSFSSNRFADAALNQAQNYDRRHRKYIPFSELLDTLRRHAAFDVPLRFVLDRDSESAGFFKRAPQWDFGTAGVRFEKGETETGQPMLVVTWSADYPQKTLDEIVAELKGLGFEDGATIAIRLVSPSGESKQSRYGNDVKIDKDGTTIHFTGSWM